jgi:hypothetical protein
MGVGSCTPNTEKKPTLVRLPTPALCSVYRMRNYGKPKQECSFRFTGNRNPPEIAAERGISPWPPRALLAVCSVYRMRNYGKPKQECSFRFTGNRHPPEMPAERGISPLRACALLIHLRDIIPGIPGQCNDGTITVKSDRGGIPQSFQENPKSTVPVPR